MPNEETGLPHLGKTKEAMAGHERPTAWTAVYGFGGIAYDSIVFVNSFLGGDSFLGKRCVLDVVKFEIPTF